MAALPRVGVVRLDHPSCAVDQCGGPVAAQRRQSSGEKLVAMAREAQQMGFVATMPRLLQVLDV